MHDRRSFLPFTWYCLRRGAISLFVLLSFVAANTSVAQSAPGDGTAIATLAKIRSDWVLYLRTKQLEPLLNLYSENAVFLPPSGERISGQPALHTFFQTTLSSLDGDLAFRSLNAEVSGDIAYDSGEWREALTTRATRTTVNIHGNYLIVYRRQPSAGWQILQHVWTLASPPSR